MDKTVFVYIKFYTWVNILITCVYKYIYIPSNVFEGGILDPLSLAEVTCVSTGRGDLEPRQHNGYMDNGYTAKENDTSFPGNH